MKPYRGLQVLENLPPWDGKRLCRIETAADILALLGNPQDQIPSVHVAGTNGKGSVCSAIASCLLAAGHTVGQFASPHLTHATERCIINGKPISVAEFDQVLNRTFDACEELNVQGSYFVIGMIASLLAFAERKLDWIVVEVGVGGLWDATNTIRSPRASVITHIGFDHTHILGDTLEAITENKAGIIKDGRPVFVGANEPGVVEVIKRAAAQKSAPVHQLGRDFCYDLVSRTVSWDQTHVDFPPEADLVPARAENLALAARVAGALGCSTEAITTGLAAMRWPGRLETFSVSLRRGTVTVAADGMHNADGTPVVVEFLRSTLSCHPRITKLRVVFAMREAKDWLQVIQLLREGIAGFAQLRGATEWIFTGADLPGMTAPEQFLQVVPEGVAVAKSQDAVRETYSNIDANLEHEHTLVVVTGSLYLLGEVRPLMTAEPFSTFAPLPGAKALARSSHADSHGNPQSHRL